MNGSPTFSLFLLYGRAQAESKKEEIGEVAEKTKSVSAMDWKHLYFYGITKKNVSEISLSQDMVQSLIGMVDIQTSVNSGVAIDPKYMFNEKGTTPWIAMYAVLFAKNPELLTDVASGTSLAHIPDVFFENVFTTHSNWPQELFNRFDLNLEKHNVFILPFMVHKSVEYALNFNQSMKAPDGSLEIFGVAEFNESKPEGLLSEIESTVKFIRDNRPDVFHK